MAAVHGCGFELVDNLPYSPDLAQSIFCSPKWKKEKRKNLAWKQYRADEVVSAVEDFFEDQDESFYTTGIQAPQHGWNNGIYTLITLYT